MAKKILLLTVLGLFLIVNLIFCPSLATKPVLAAETIKIGALLPLTGALLHQGPKVQRGIEMALADAGWQVAGKKIELIVEDSATDPTHGLDKARKLVERDKVIAIIGPQHSGVCNAIQPYVNKNKVLNFKSREFPKGLIAKYPYLVVVNGTQKQTCAPMGWYTYDKLGYKTVTTLGSDYIAGRAFVGGFMDGFKEKGGTVVQEQWFPVGCVDFAPYLAALKQADVLAAWVAGPGSLRLLSQYHEYGVAAKMPLIGAYASSILDEDILPQLGDRGLGYYGPTAYASTVDNALNKQVLAACKQKYGTRTCDNFMMGGYMNVFVLLNGLKASKGDTDPERLRKSILAIDLKDTPIGPVKFTPQGGGILNIRIIKTSKIDGEYVQQVVHTYEGVPPL